MAPPGSNPHIQPPEWAHCHSEDDSPSCGEYIPRKIHMLLQSGLLIAELRGIERHTVKFDGSLVRRTATSQLIVLSRMVCRSASPRVFRQVTLPSLLLSASATIACRRRMAWASMHAPIQIIVESDVLATTRLQGEGAPRGPGRRHDGEVAADHLVGRRGKARDFASLASPASLIAPNYCH
jgi:hypothetical protein